MLFVYYYKYKAKAWSYLCGALHRFALDGRELQKRENQANFHINLNWSHSNRTLSFAACVCVCATRRLHWIFVPVVFRRWKIENFIESCASDDRKDNEGMKTRRCEVGAHTKHGKNTHSKQINKVFQLTPPAIDVNRCFLLYFFVCLPHPLLEASSTFIYCCSLESHLDFFQILKGFSRLDIIETFLMRFI